MTLNDSFHQTPKETIKMELNNYVQIFDSHISFSIKSAEQKEKHIP